jgi:nucleotide-binding universal stress UspA family protein
MRRDQKILVLVDGSERSFETIRQIGCVKPFIDAKIVIYHVFAGMPDEILDLEKQPASISGSDEIELWKSHQKKSIEIFMEQAKQDLITAGFSKDAVEIKIANRDKGVARDILTEARKEYFAVAMGRRGMGRVEALAVGSIAGKLISKLTFVPLIITGRALPLEKILVGIDGSDHSIRAAEFTGEVFGGYGYSVKLLHVIRGFGGFVPEGPEFMMPAECLEGLQFEMKKLFMPLRDKLLKAGFDEDKIHEKIISGACSRAEAIIEEAQSEGRHTIVLGRKGLSSIQEFFMGRVSDRVIQMGKEFTVWIV